MTRLRDWADALRALNATGLLGPAPLRSLLGFGWCLLRFGPSLYTVVAWNARRWPHRLALSSVTGDRTETVSYRDLLHQADRWAARLDQHNIEQYGRRRAAFPPRVALLCRDHVAFVALLLACGKLGLEAALLDPASSPAQVEAACRAQGTDLLLYEDGLMPTLREAGMELLPVSALDSAAAPPSPRRRIRRGRAALVLLSSGTTGTPKAVRRRPNLGALLSTLTALLTTLQPRVGAPTLLTLPLFHGHGLATLGLSLTLAAPLYLFARGRPEEHWRCLEDERIEVLVLVPTVLYRLLHAVGAAPALRTIVCGSAPLGAALAEDARQVFGPVLFNLYGSSEAGLISLATPQDLLDAPGTVGRVLPGVEVRLQPTATGSPPLSQVTVRGPLVSGSSFFGTGDLGWFSPSGHLHLAGRQDDLLVIGGENVWPEMIEERVAQLAAVLECAVTPLPSAEYGQAVHAHVVLRRGQEQVTAEALQRDLQEILPRRLRPAAISIVEALPRTQTGKLRRGLLNPGVPQAPFTAPLTAPPDRS